MLIVAKRAIQTSLGRRDFSTLDVLFVFFPASNRRWALIQEEFHEAAPS